MTFTSPKVPIAKPFLKWAGGKSQLIPVIQSALPKDLNTRKNLTYIEPFIGSGAILFWLLQNFSNIKKAVINDINADLINAYSIIKEAPLTLINELEKIENEYYKFKNEDERKLYFLNKREVFNARYLNSSKSTAILIFLNRTCFNGLYRVNSKNQFNVPFGKYYRPTICDRENILAGNLLLQKVTIMQGDYKETLHQATEKSFFYIDPPYKPISKTSSFNSYAKNIFDDGEQVRLKSFVIYLLVTIINGY